MLLELWPSFVVTIVATDSVSGATPTTVIKPLGLTATGSVVFVAVPDQLKPSPLVFQLST